MTFEDLLGGWQSSVRCAQKAHFRTASLLERRHFWIGVPAVVLSTVVGSSVFASMQEKASPYAKLAVAIASIAAAILAALQTFLRFAERAERHRVIGTSFSALKKELQFRRVYPPRDAASEESYAADFLKRWSQLVESSPTADERVFQFTRQEVKQASAQLAEHGQAVKLTSGVMAAPQLPK
jgi:hypothetical protein